VGGCCTRFVSLCNTYKMRNNLVLMNGEFVRMWQKVTAAYLKLFSRHLSEGTRENARQD
jgi:hypothetical protein